MSSNGATSLTSSAPASCHAGRPAAKLSSITHCLNGSADDRRLVAQAQRRGRRREIGIGRRRHDAVDHGRRERDIAADPGRQFVVAQAANDATSDATVLPLCGRLSQHSTVTGPAPGAAVAPARPPARPASRAARPVLQIVADIGMARIQLARCRVAAIALLRDRDRDDLGRGSAMRAITAPGSPARTEPRAACRSPCGAPAPCAPAPCRAHPAA